MAVFIKTTPHIFWQGAFMKFQRMFTTQGESPYKNIQFEKEQVKLKTLMALQATYLK